jgi:hypothetical protein
MRFQNASNFPSIFLDVSGSYRAGLGKKSIKTRAICPKIVEKSAAQPRQSLFETESRTSGVVLASGKLDSRLRQISTTTLSNGLYFVQIRVSDNQPVTIKFVVQKY